MTGGWQPTVSVVVPVLDGEQTIGDCIDSLLRLRYPAERVELLVVDNGSRDGTAAVLQQYGSRIVRLDESTRGPAAARNAGLHAARGEVVALTDADCQVDPDWLTAIVAPLVDPRVGVAGGTIRALPPANEVERFGEVIHDHRQAIEELEPPYAITMNWASRHAVLEEFGGFDERFRRGEDVDLSYRVIQAGYTLTFAPTAVVYHHNEVEPGRPLPRRIPTRIPRGVGAQTPRRVRAGVRSRASRSAGLHGDRRQRARLGAQQGPSQVEM